MVVPDAAARLALVWHRGDLRTHDHPALSAAAVGACAGVVVFDPNILQATTPRRRALFAANVDALRASYAALGGELFVRAGLPWQELPALAQQLGAHEVHALRSYTPYGRERDLRTETALLQGGVFAAWHGGLYIHEPGTILTGAAAPYSVYSPYFRNWSAAHSAVPLPAPEQMQAKLPRTVARGDVPHETSDVTLPEPGEVAALARLETFVEQQLGDYADARNRLDGSGSSRLSIDITLGTLSPRHAYDRVRHRRGAGAAKWVGELAWRDFLADVLYHRPHLLREPFDARYAAIEWDGERAAFEAWRDGRTGIPVVDAAMRQLRATGWISNRARMIAAQFLTKHLRVDWRLGERVFRNWLLDGDAASNVGNWQWAAGLGIDNAPYFRVFNPVTQGKQYDPDGTWLARWAPESNGRAEPLPHAIVDVSQARREYLAAMEITLK